MTSTFIHSAVTTVAFWQIRLFLSLRLAVGPLLTVFSFLPGRTAAMGTGNIFLFLSLCLHFIFLASTFGCSFESDSILKYLVKFVHSCRFVKKHTANGLQFIPWANFSLSEGRGG